MGQYINQDIIRNCFMVGQTVLVRSGNDWHTREILRITVLRHDVTCQECHMPIQGEPRLWFKDYGNVPLSDVMAMEDINPYHVNKIATPSRVDDITINKEP